MVWHKYIAPSSITEWIRYPWWGDKEISYIWKAVLDALDVIRSGLAWDIGKGDRFCIGRDPWPGSGEEHILPPTLVDRLEQSNVLFLSQVGNPLGSTICYQGWKSGDSLGLDEEHFRVWDIYLGALRRAHIRLSYFEGTLVWDLSADGIYRPKEGYIALCADRFSIDPKSRWWGLWKLHCAMKEKFLWWLIMENKVPTWDFLQNRSFVGLSRCCLCTSEVESVQHFFLECGVVQNVWKKILNILHIIMVCHGRTMEESFSLWWNTVGSKSLRMMSLIISWGIWIARNKCIFKNIRRSILEIVAKAVGLIVFFSDTDVLPRQRLCPTVKIDENIPWAFFDGVARGDPVRYGSGILLHFDAHNYI